MGFCDPRLPQAKRRSVVPGVGFMRPLKQRASLPPQPPRCGKVLCGHGLRLGDEGVAGLEAGGGGVAGHGVGKRTDGIEDCRGFAGRYQPIPVGGLFRKLELKI